MEHWAMQYIHYVEVRAPGASERKDPGGIRERDQEISTSIDRVAGSRSMPAITKKQSRDKIAALFLLCA